MNKLKHCAVIGIKALTVCVVLLIATYVYHAKFAEDGLSITLPDFVFGNTNKTVNYAWMIHKSVANPWGTLYREHVYENRGWSERADGSDRFDFEAHMAKRVLK